MAVTLTITATPEIASVNGVTCRVWRGKTAKGADIVAFVAAIGTTPESDAEAAAELQPLLLSGSRRTECEQAMEAALLRSIDLRHII